MNLLNGISQVENYYDYFIFDVWGVVHDGSNVYPNVIETLEYLRKANKKICFLSNAPRRANKVEKVLNNFGVKKKFYDFVLTSGESAFQDLLLNQENNFSKFGKRYLYIGPNKDLDVLDGLQYQRVDNANEADFVLNTGFDHDDSKISEKLPIAIQASKYKLPMLCVNPDIIVVKQDGREMICAGALALEYKKLGGAVHFYGKPYSKVYQLTLDKFSLSNKSKVVAIGDGLETDIKGANEFGIDNILVSGGILANELGVKYWQNPEEKNLNEVCGKYKIFPKYIISNLKI